MKTGAKPNSRRGRVKGIYQRGNIFWFTKMDQGKRVQVSLGTDDYGAAVQKALEIAHAPFLDAAEPLEGEIREFIAYKVRQNEYSRDSAATKHYVLGHFAKFVNQRDPALIPATEVERFYRAQQTRVSESTAQGYVTTLRSFFNWLVSARKVRSNPVTQVKLARLDQRARVEFCTPEVRDKLIAECQKDDLRFVLYCGFHAGLRKQEIIEARPSWFDLNAGRLDVRATETFRPKDREARTIPLTSAFQKFLAGYTLRAPYMLHPEVTPGRNRYRWDFRRPYADYMKAHGCDWVTPHIMRHTFASLLASKGVSIFKIAQWLGDDVRVVQKHYAKLLPKDDDIEKAF